MRGSARPRKRSDRYCSGFLLRIAWPSLASTASALQRLWETPRTVASSIRVRQWRAPRRRARDSVGRKLRRSTRLRAVSAVWTIAPSKSRLRRPLGPKGVRASCHFTPQCFSAVLLRVEDQAGKSVPQEQFASISLSLGQQRKENVPHLRCNLFRPENFERLGEIKNLRDGWRFFHAPAAQRLRESGHSRMKFATRIRRSQRYNFCLSLRGWVFNAEIKTTSTEGIADTPFLVRCEYNKRNATGSNRSEFWNAQLPNTQKF